MPRFFQGPRCKNKVRLDGKIVVITGANTGIGRETARELSRRGTTICDMWFLFLQLKKMCYFNNLKNTFAGAEIVIACRDLSKAKEAAEEIIKETGKKVTTIKLDLASLSSIREAAEELKALHPNIHILINNAGQFSLKLFLLCFWIFYASFNV